MALALLAALCLRDLQGHGVSKRVERAITFSVSTAFRGLEIHLRLVDAW